MPQLLDQFGRPIDTARLKEEIAAPSITGVRQILSGHPAQGLTPQRLRWLLLDAEAGDPVAYLELAEEMEEKDLHYLGVLGTRKRQVSQLEITVEAASSDAADVKAADRVRAWLDRDTLQDELFDVLDAVGKGYSLCELVWGFSSKEWLPERIEWRDPRWFGFDRIDGKTPLLKDDNGQLTPLEPLKFIFHQHKAKSGLPIRGGLARAAAWSYLFKNYALKDWVAFAEVFGLPLRVGKYRSGETEDNIRILRNAVANIGSDAAAVIPESMLIEFVDAKGTQSDGLFLKLCDFLDRQVSKSVLGQTATTDADTGGLGSGEEHGRVRDDIRDADATLIAATLNRDLVRPIVDLNDGPRARYPRVKIGASEMWDPTTMMPAVQTFVSMGGKVGMRKIGDKLGLPEPEPDEELLAAPGGAQNTPLEGQEGLSGIRGAGKPGRASEPFLRLLTGHPEARETAARAAAGELDAVDLLIEAEIAGWAAAGADVIAEVERAAAAASSLEELRDKLAGAFAAMDTAELARRLARAGFAARLDGAAGDA